MNHKISKSLLIMISKCSIYLLLLFLINPLIAAKSLGQDLKEIEIEHNQKAKYLLQIFEEVEQQTDFRFFFDKKVSSITSTIDIEEGKINLFELLTIASRDANVKFHRENKSIWVKANETREKFVFYRPIRGKVVDEDGNPLPGASVVEKGTFNGTSTDFDGNYTINVSEDNAVLVFSYVGYVSKEIRISDQPTLDVILETSSTQLGDVVVVGYGTLKKVNLTGAVATIGTEEINNRPVTQPSQILQGLAPGVFVNTNSGEPGNDQANITIRGIGTLGNTSPLVLIDGIEAPINSVNPQDIESISVLKDAASAAIYGTRGANGVILITTKTGSFDKPIEIVYDGYFGITNPTVIPELVWDNQTYLELYREAAINSGLPVNYTDEDITRYASLPSTDWMEVVIEDDAPITNHNISFTGGSSNTNYYFSSGFLYQQGYLIDKSRYNRISNRLNLNTKLTNKLTFGSNVYYFREFGTLEPKENNGAFREGRGPESFGSKGGVVWSGGFINHPIAPVFDALGRYGSIEQDLGIERNRPNPVGVADNEEVELDANDLLAKLSLVYEPIEDLSFTGILGINYQSDIVTTTQKEYGTFDPVTLEPWTNGNGIRNLGNVAYRDLITTYNLTTWLQADYKLTSNKNELDFLVGYNYENQNNTNQRILEQQFASSDVVEIGQGQLVESSQQILQTKLASVFGRFSYNYDKKYLVEANFRGDASSRFGANNRWGFFPAFSGGWVLTNESFWSEDSFIGFLKVRGSWGIIGNQSTNAYPFISQVSLNSAFNGEGGAALTRLGNPDLQWEETETTNLGLESRFFKGRLSLEADYFIKKTDNILTEQANPLTSGIVNTTTVNAASIENKGLEINASYNNSFGYFSFGISGNVTYVENEVTAINSELADENDRIEVGSQFGSNAYIIRGFPMNVILGHEQNGIFQQDDFNEDGSLKAGIPDHSFIGNPIPGGFRYTDQNGDGLIDEADQVVIGDRQPKWFYGASLTLGYRGLQLSALIQGIGKSDAWINRSMGPFPFAGLRHHWAENRWTPENPSNEHPAVWVDRSGYNGEAVQRGGKVIDYWVVDRSYLRLKNIRIAYDLPDHVLNRLPFKSLQIYVNGQNLWTLTDLKDIDPERPDFSNNADAALPQSKIVLLGLNAKF